MDDVGPQLRAANLKLFLNEQPTTPWEALNVIISDVIYGGRVTDKQDVRLTRAILGDYLNEPPSTTTPTRTARSSTTDSATARRRRARSTAYSKYMAPSRSSTGPRSSGCTRTRTSPARRRSRSRCSNTIISLQPRTGGGGGGKTSDEIVGEVGDDLVSKLPKPMSMKDAGETTFCKLKTARSTRWASSSRRR